METQQPFNPTDYLAGLVSANNPDPFSRPELMRRLAAFMPQQPVEGVNVHTEPAKSPAWIQEQTIEPLPFGSLADPVSQVAFLAAPGVLRAGKQFLDTVATPGPRLGSIFAGERGNLGPPPVGPKGEPLPTSVVRTPEGQLQKLYHGTKRAYPDFDIAQAGSGAGGDLYGPGIYLTENAGKAGEYATIGRPVEEKLVEGLPWERVIDELKRRGIKTTGGDVVIRQEGSDASGALYTAIRKVPVGANVRPVYADLKKPFDIEGQIPKAEVRRIVAAAQAQGHVDTSLVRHIQEQYGQESSILGKELYQLLESYSDGGKAGVNTMLQRVGYDGIKHMGGIRGGEPHQVYIAFSPEQVYPSVNVDALQSVK